MFSPACGFCGGGWPVVFCLLSAVFFARGRCGEVRGFYEFGNAFLVFRWLVVVDEDLLAMFGHACYEVVFFRVGTFGVFRVWSDVGFNVWRYVRLYNGLDIWGYHSVHVRRVFSFFGGYLRDGWYHLPFFGVIAWPLYFGFWFAIAGCLVASFPRRCGFLVAVCIALFVCWGPVAITWAGWIFVSVRLIWVVVVSVCIDHRSFYFVRSRVFVCIMIVEVFLSIVWGGFQG